jgi:hypothetical protein
LRVFKKGTFQEKQEFADDDEDDESDAKENAPNLLGASDYESGFESDF